MSPMEMEWNGKWDWENYASFGSKATESPKKLQLTDWMIVDDGEIHGGSFNLSGSGGGNSGASGSNGGHGSSAKSSISASTDSSIKDGIQTPNFRFRTIEGSYGNSSKMKEMKEMELSGTSPPPEASVSSAEALLGLKLGKRTYFENSGGVKSTSFSVIPTPPTITPKKTKLTGQNALIFCQVEGCNIDLSMAKDYHRKHRVCDTHSKCPKVTIGGSERRFCQQCSRFHGLSEFDEKKRSCRRRLADHNARRRKPQQETIQFSSTGLSTPLYGGNKQMSFMLNNSPHGNSGWDSASNSKFTLTKAHSFKSYGNGGTYDQLHLPGGINTPQATINVQNGLLPSKNSTSVVPNPGSKGSLISAAPEYGRALSLLSSNSWDSCDPASIPIQHQNDSSIMNHAIPEGVPLSSSDFWLAGQHSPHLPSLPTNNNFHQNQLFKMPYDATDFYSNILN